ncbi:hypothetical protein J7E87_26075 [Streptomyces sp. ISL-1]|uniref:hypothetical protein n=1 Tax=Streptomyces sp. ISL-1 TaxID=2817657 RepID=UPI001BE5C560|nr:hypothetical protein [Streptomyces sp. ISL-1]MBT2392807.1 hypothetical protein [Streptomyces sp. ISL-1]
MTVSPHAKTGVAGYALVLPPGWARIPLRQGTEDAVREVARRTIINAPDDVPRDEVAKFQVQLEGRLQGLARQAADNAGIDLYLPTAPRGGVATPCSIVVSELQLRVGDGLDPLDVARQLAAGEDTQEVTVDGCVGARSEQVRAANPERGVVEAARSVDYALPVPGDLARWITVSFSTPGDGDAEGEFAVLLVELFDAIMTTFTWQRPTRASQ